MVTDSIWFLLRKVPVREGEAPAEPIQGAKGGSAGASPSQGRKPRQELAGHRDDVAEALGVEAVEELEAGGRRGTGRKGAEVDGVGPAPGHGL